MIPDYQITGHFKVLKWEESEIINQQSTASVHYDFYREGKPQDRFQAKANYLFFYEEHSSDNPLKSHTHYTGHMAMHVILDGSDYLLQVKDQGEFKNGLASSNLKVLPNSLFEGDGNYQASHEDNNFKLVLRKK